MEMIIFCILIIIFAVILLLKLFFKIRVRHSFKQDKVIQKEIDEYQNTILYKISSFASPVTAKYISRYTFVTRDKQKSLVVAYSEPMKMIKYNVYVYTLGSKIIEVLEIEERNCSEISRDIMLPKKCRKVNIEVVEIDNEIVNKPLKKVSTVSLFIYSLFTYAFVSMCLYGLVYITFSSEVASGNILEILSLGLIYFLSMFIYLFKKNRRDVDANGTD